MGQIYPTQRTQQHRVLQHGTPFGRDEKGIGRDSRTIRWCADNTNPAWSSPHMLATTIHTPHMLPVAPLCELLLFSLAKVISHSTAAIHE